MIDEEVNRLFDQSLESIRESEARTLETMRDMQTEILGHLERFPRGNFAVP